MVVVSLLTIAAFVVAMAIFGPLDTARDFGPWMRLLYWGLCATITWPFCYAMAAAVLYAMRLRSPLASVPAIAVSMLVAGVLCTIVVCTADLLFRPHFVSTKHLPKVYVTVTTVVALCSSFIHYVIYLRVARRPEVAQRGVAGREDAATLEDRPATLEDRPATPEDRPATPEDRPATPEDRPATPEDRPAAPAVADAPPDAKPPAEEAAAESRTRFFHGLPIDPDEIVYLKMDDHYVEVYTDSGSRLIRMRFADAVGDLGDRGIQVHRSYWVAHGSMAGLRRRGNRTLLRLADGRTVPVSRTYLAQIRAALQKRSG